jgi:hydrogenase nickel incorporation protein HypB
MCESCGCGDHELVPLEIQEKVLAGNDAAARHNREHFAGHQVLAINLMGSPGAGKTAVLETTARRTQGRWSVSALSGDLATDHDARRLAAVGITAGTITTGSACHLDAHLVHEALHLVPWQRSDLFFIENVGNLVCPAIYDLGQQANVVALSVTEGEDKPLKYPVMFKVADLVLITKIDLLPHLPSVSLQRLQDNVARVMPTARMIPLAATTGTGFDDWFDWLQSQLDRLRPPGVRFHAAAHHAAGHQPGGRRPGTAPGSP